MSSKRKAISFQSAESANLPGTQFSGSLLQLSEQGWINARIIRNTFQEQCSQPETFLCRQFESTLTKR